MKYQKKQVSDALCLASKKYANTLSTDLLGISICDEKGVFKWTDEMGISLPLALVAQTTQAE